MFPNRLEQHITDIKKLLINEMQQFNQQEQQQILSNQISSTQDFEQFI